MEMINEMFGVFKTSFVGIWDKVSVALVGIIWGLILLIVGLFLSRWIGSAIKAILNKIKLDEATSKLGINELFTRVGFGKSPTAVLAFIATWVIMIVFIVAAAEVMRLNIIGDLLQHFLNWLPNLFVGIVIIFAGLLFGKFISNILKNSAKVNNLKGGYILAEAVNIAIIVFAGLMALEEIGIALPLVNSIILILMGAFGIAFGISVGLGAKGIVEDFLKDKVKKGNK